MSRRRLKQYLMLLTAVGIIAVAASGSGTFATFNAEVTNPGNTFAAGTLFLHDTNGSTTCTSESATSGPNFNVNPGDGTNGNQCATLFNADLAGGVQTAQLALQNAGTLSSSDLTFKVASCTVGTNQSQTGSTVTFGSAPTCGNLDITIQETQSDYSTHVYCAYGPATTQPDCDTPNNTVTLASASSFQQLKTTGNANATLSPSQTRYYLISIKPDVTSDNTLQNRKVTFGLTWHIDS